MIENILAINLGSTSTKIACYEADRLIFQENLPHPVAEIRDFPDIWSQFAYRKEAVERVLEKKGVRIQDLQAVVTRGGHTRPIEGGIYRITPQMLKESRSEQYGNHPTDLGLLLAVELAGENVEALTVDPPSTDEFEPLARYSGLPGIERKSRFHVLNQRAVGKQYAREHGRIYEELNLIVTHMGGGISVAVHKKGKLVDATNALDGDGPFSTNRACGLPVGQLAALCYSGKYSYGEMKALLNGRGGLVAYVGDSDVKTVEERARAGEAACREALEAMCYQTAKEIGSCAAVLEGKVDAILLTGGIAYSDFITGKIEERVRFLAPVHRYPGEYEMQSLALHALEGLRDPQKIKEISEEVLDDSLI